MALATSCPRCQTSFRVVPDQLKARRGLVRCGTCNEVFSGIDTLRYVDEPGDTETPGLPPGLTSPETMPLASTIPPPAMALPPRSSQAGGTGGPPSAPAPAFEHPRESFADLSWIETAQPGGAPALTPPAEPDWLADARSKAPPVGASWSPPAPRAGTTPTGGPDDLFGTEGPATAWNLPDTTEPLFPEPPPALPQDNSAAAGTPTGTTRQPGGLAASPVAATAALDSLTFLKPPAPRKPLSPAQRRATTFVSLLLAVALLVQAALTARDWLAAWAPDLEPVLSTLSSLAGRPLQAPRALDALTLESFELQATHTDDHFAMRAMLRNRAQHPVRWPAMELSLTDSAGTVVARKVLIPADYLSGNLPRQGVPARSEQSIQIALQATGLKPTGYNVKLFYP